MTTTAQIASLLKPDLHMVFGDYESYPTEWKEIFETRSSEWAEEKAVEMRFLPYASLMTEGQGTPMDDGMGERYTTTAIHQYYGLGFVITRKAIKDNLYKSRFPKQAKALRRSFDQTKEVNGAAILNNAFDSNYPFGDGQELCSVDHPIDTGTMANTLSSQADLNETSLQDIIETIGQFKDQAGLRTMVKPRKLVVPLQLQWQACKLLESPYEPSSAANPINPFYKNKSIPGGYVVNHFLTDSNAWFVLTDADDGFVHFQREPLETDVQPVGTTWSVRTIGIERYSFTVFNVRAVAGCSGTS